MSSGVIVSTAMMTVLAMMAMMILPNRASAGGPTTEVEPRGVSVAIIEVGFEGDVKPAAHDPIREALTNGFEAAGVAVVGSDEVAARDLAASQCQTSSQASQTSCLAEAATRLGVSHAVVLEVVATGNDYGIVLTVVDRSGWASKRDSQCQICGFAEVATMVRDQASAFGPALLRADQPASFHIDSTPPHAEVRIDDELVGRTPIDVEVAPGSHLITVSTPGYSGAQSELVAVAGVEERLVLGLVELPEQRDPERMRRFRVAGWSLIGVGVGLAGVGGATLALHHREPTKRCTSDAIDVNGVCQWHYDTLPLAIPLLASGAAAIVTGSILAAIAGKRARGRNANEVAVGLGPDGVWLSGRF